MLQQELDNDKKIIEAGKQRIAEKLRKEKEAEQYSKEEEKSSFDQQNIKQNERKNFEANQVSTRNQISQLANQVREPQINTSIKVEATKNLPKSNNHESKVQLKEPQDRV